LVSLVLHAVKPEFHGTWVHVFKICLIILSSVIGVFNIIAILKNVQCTRNKT
jgi:hypothetical protein